MFGSTVHKYSAPFSGNATAALDVARTALLALGFEIQRDSPTLLVAEGPGMHSNRQPELLGATSIQLKVSSSKISSESVLGGVATMKSFVYLFPPGLVIFLLSLNNFAGAGIGWFHLLWVLPWFAIAPLIGASLERKTVRAIERLVRGMAQARRN